MPIISISIHDDLLERMDELKTELDFSGRSELVRTAVRGLIRERSDVDALTGTIDSIVIATHEDASSEDLSDIQHRYEEIIKTQIHNHLERHTCLEIFVLHGAAAEIRAFWDELQASDETDQTKLITP